jgi:hypothetical protein
MKGKIELLMKKFTHLLIVISTIGIYIPALGQELSTLNKKNLIKVTGGYGLGVNHISVIGREAAQPALTYNFNANLNVNVAGALSLPFSFAYSSNTVSTAAPNFNITQLTPSYKWAKLYLGNTMMSLSPYTMAGTPFTGAGFELTPKNWKIAGFYGLLKRAQEQQPNSANSAVSYERKGYGLAISHTNQVIGDIGVAFLKAKDDPNSISFIPEATTSTPQDNLAISLDYRRKFLKMFNLQATYAMSVYTRDIRSDINNTSLKPFDNFIDNRTNTTNYNALDLGLSFNIANLGLLFNYKRIDPGFQSLGAYNINNNLESFGLNSNFSLFQGKVNVNTTHQLNQNNIDKTAFKTQYIWNNAINTNINLIPKVNVNLGYNNNTSFSNLQRTLTPFSVQQDSFSVFTLADVYNSSISFQLGAADNPQMVILSGNMVQSKIERGNLELNNLALNNSVSRMVNLSHSFRIKSAELQISNSANYNVNDLDAVSTVNYGISNSLSKSFFKNTINCSLSNTYNMVQANVNSSLVSSNLMASYALKPKVNSTKNILSENHRFGLSFRMTKQFAPEGMPSIAEFLSSLNYSWSF